MAPVPESSPSDPVDPRDPRDPLRPEPRSRPDSTPVTEPLARCALETERHVGTAGWDQAPRVFALVETEALLAAEPQLRESMSVTDLVPGALTAIEQEGFARTSSIETLLGRLTWPDRVLMAAMRRALRRTPDEAAAKLLLPRTRVDQVDVATLDPVAAWAAG